MDTTDDAVIKRKVAEYALAEDRGASLLDQMVEFAPEEHEREFIKQQLADEIKHSRLFQEEAVRLNAEEEFFLSSLEKLYDIGQRCVDRKDWIECMVCQSIIEEIALASFSSFYPRTDEQTQEVLREIIDDEKAHLDFTIEQLDKWVKTDEDRQKVTDLQTEMMDIFIGALSDGSLQKEIPSTDEQKQFNEVLKKTYLFHKKRFESIGLRLPKIPMKYLIKIGLQSTS